MNFRYKALDETGKVVQGFFEGDNQTSVTRLLQGKGIFVLQVRPLTPLLSYFSKAFKGGHIKRRDIIEFASNLSFMQRAGIPLLTSLSDIGDTIQNEHFRPIVKSILQDIEMGMAFSKALAQHKPTIPDIMIRLVEVGEETGLLTESLTKVAAHLQKMEDLSAAIKRALIYPAFSLVAVGGALIFWLAFVLPKIMVFVIDMGAKLPPLTRAMAAASHFTEKYWWSFPLSIVLTIVLIQIIKMKKETKYYWDLAKLKIPIVKLVAYNKLLALFTEQFRLLISSGVPIDRCFDVIADVTGSEVFKRAILDAKESVMAGGRISAALAAHSIFPPLLIRMTTIGETSGSLDEQFAFLAEYYYKVVDDVAEKLSKMLEPIMIGILGMIMALMMAAIFMPMYDVISTIQK